MVPLLTWCSVGVRCPGTVAHDTTPRTEAPSLFTALRGIRQRGDYTELLDQPGQHPAVLRGNLRDLRMLNRWLGWRHAAVRDVWSLRPDGGGSAHTTDTSGGTPVPARFTTLDIATGSGDLPRALVDHAMRVGVAIRVIGSDMNRDITLVARSTSSGTVQLIQHDAAALPFADRSVDVVTLCLAAHHLDPCTLQRTLAECGRVARQGVVVSDLRRSIAGYLGARLMAMVLRNALTAHDGPVSVLRAYTLRELGRIARAAGLPHIRVRRDPYFRMTLIARMGVRGSLTDV